MSFLKKALFIAMGLSLSGCLGQTNVFNPASPIAGAEARLFQIILIMSLVVFLIVDGGLVFILLRNRARKDKDDPTPPRQVYENRLLEAIWTGIPILIVIVLFILTVSTMRAVAAPPRAAGDVEVNVIGHQWWWEFDYPGLGIKTANELHMPVGTNVHLNLTSVDVIHSFWPPQLSGKIDAIPGQTNTMWLTSDQAGVYAGQCAEFCGLEHAIMRFKVVVEFEGILPGLGQPAAAGARCPDRCSRPAGPETGDPGGLRGLPCHRWDQCQGPDRPEPDPSLLAQHLCRWGGAVERRKSGGLAPQLGSHEARKQDGGRPRPGERYPGHPGLPAYPEISAGPDVLLDK